MKKSILALIAVCTFSYAVAQKETKYEKLFYKDLKVENNDVSIIVDNAVSTEGETKFKLKIINKTNDILIYKPEESKFIINGKEFTPSEKWKIIDPNSDNWLIVNLKGTGYNAVKSYSFLVSGLYRVSTSEKGITAEDFKLPASKNDFKVGPYTVSLNKLKKESDATNLKLDIKYNGDKVGVVYPTKAGVVMPDGKEYAAVKPSGLLARTGPILLQKGETSSATLNWDRMEGGKAMDMQKVDMNVKFNEMFTEVTPEKMKPETLQLEFDEVTSNAKK